MTLPTFLVVGAAKSGTTSLCHYLRQHPDVFVAREKEVHHFAYPELAARLNGPGDADGLGHLLMSDRAAYEQCFRGAEGFRARGEASVYYSAEPASLVRALEAEPEMRFVYVIRHPADRCRSAYGHMRRDGREPLPLEAALADENRRRDEGWSHGFLYQEMSDYPAQIEAMRRVVPEDRLHVAVFEELLESGSDVMAQLFDFLGVRPFGVDTSLAMNQSGSPRSQMLNDFFVTDNAVKRTLKRVVPYRLGVAVAHRIRNGNLRQHRLQLPPDAEQRFAGTIRSTEDLLGRRIDAWHRRERVA